MQAISPLTDTPSISNRPVAYAYSPFSTKELAQGDSERRQKDKAQTWADASGYSLEHLHDPGISAFHGRNQIIGQFSVFLEAVRARQLGPGPVLLIENFDRMPRMKPRCERTAFHQNRRRHERCGLILAYARGLETTGLGREVWLWMRTGQADQSSKLTDDLTGRADDDCLHVA